MIFQDFRFFTDPTFTHRVNSCLSCDDRKKEIININYP